MGILTNSVTTECKFCDTDCFQENTSTTTDTSNSIWIDKDNTGNLSKADCLKNLGLGLFIGIMPGIIMKGMGDLGKDDLNLALEKWRSTNPNELRFAPLAFRKKNPNRQISLEAYERFCKLDSRSFKKLGTKVSLIGGAIGLVLGGAKLLYDYKSSQNA